MPGRSQLGQQRCANFSRLSHSSDAAQGSGYARASTVDDGHTK